MPNRSCCSFKGASSSPLSPYLFLLCAEAYSSLISKAVIRGNLVSSQCNRHGPQVSHLFFLLMIVLCLLELGGQMLMLL